MSEEKRRWQFSIRDVLVVTLIVGLAVGWFVDHRRLANELERKRTFQWVLGSSSPNFSYPLQMDGTITIQPNPTITDPPPESPMP